MFSGILDSDLFDEINWANVEFARRTALRIHESGQWHQYYNFVIFPIIKYFLGYESHSRLLRKNNWIDVYEQLNIPEKLEIDIVQFLIQDALYYIDACDATHYNPLWIFGSKHYEETINSIWRI